MAKKWMNLFHSQDRRKAELEQTFKEEKVALDKEIEQERPSFEAELLRQGMNVCFYVCMCHTGFFLH